LFGGHLVQTELAAHSEGWRGPPGCCVCKQLSLYESAGLGLLKQTTKKLSTIFVHRNIEPDPKNMDM
jgi:hypothetical protein